MTRQEVIKAARKLYAVPGYAQTTVDKIAREARVSPATVYAQCGGKEGLLRTLMDIWTTSPTVGQIIADSAAAPTGRTKLEVLAAGYAAHAAEAGDIMRIVERAAPSSPAAQTFLDVADQRHIEALEMIVEGIAGNGDLAEDSRSRTQRRSSSSTSATLNWSSPWRRSGGASSEGHGGSWIGSRPQSSRTDGGGRVTPSRLHNSSTARQYVSVSTPRQREHRAKAAHNMVTIHHRYAMVDGYQIFYREAGPRDRPTLVLLHGFPASSLMFRHLLPRLADRWHLVAPDHVGFGLSDAPTVDEFTYSFDSLTDITGALLTQLGIERYCLFVHDHGAPIGWRLALRAPDAVTAIITQNGNAYAEGLQPEFFITVCDYWKSRPPRPRPGFVRRSPLS
ncbi:alpha/beta fold hydrolase [Streptosporangium lutulentum]